MATDRDKSSHLQINEKHAGGLRPDNATPNRGAWISYLTNLTVLQLEGEDTATFLQGQTTCDVNELSTGTAAGGALCNPKGRAITGFTLLCLEAGRLYWMILPAVLAPTVEKKLRMYVMRSKVTISTPGDNLCVAGLRYDAASTPALPIALPDRAGLVSRNEHLTGIQVEPDRWICIGETESIRELQDRLASGFDFVEASPDWWNLRNVLAGIPTLDTRTTELFVPQMLNLDQLGHISFKKGCYTGQEIVARMHYLGKLKRRMYLARLDRIPEIEPSDPVMAAGNDSAAGQVVNTAIDGQTFYALVVLQIELADSSDLSFQGSTGTPLKILNLPYTSGDSD